MLLLGETVNLVIGYGKKKNVFVQVNSHDKQYKSLVVILSERSNERDNERNKAKLSDSDSQAQKLKQVKQVKKQLELYLKARAQDYILPRLAVLSEQTSLVPQQVNIRQYRARWGSCNSRKEVNFNYLLMMTPTWVIDYVILHELCHLTFLNHSTDFWQLVSHHYPRYEEAKQWLRNHQNALVWQLPH